ncbi:hypothetical protein [Rhizobium sp. EC-SD404]|uniref:hypothetical protein n=1 Tax=Rhizobium sp. EC-SD404 TaxID=2038389 RepID=UPI001253D1EF|nr:hypothetical protein [Rhizobium sp. EC-SD404]VVS96361.1 hypothetical protein RHIZ404_140009 [Rhizobium sp. EC-SD404]
MALQDWDRIGVSTGRRVWSCFGTVNLLSQKQFFETTLLLSTLQRTGREHSMAMMAQ